MLWYLLEAPCQSTSNEYTQHIFFVEKLEAYYVDTPLIWSYKNIHTFLLKKKKCLICSYALPSPLDLFGGKTYEYKEDKI